MSNKTVSETRHCAYCGKTRCQCAYKFKRMAKRAIRVENVTVETTAGEMQQQFAEVFAKIPPEQHGLWSIAYSQLDETKFAKAQLKRGEAIDAEPRK